MLSVLSKPFNAECRYDKCRYALCRGALSNVKQSQTLSSRFKANDSISRQKSFLGCEPRCCKSSRMSKPCKKFRWWKSYLNVKKLKDKFYLGDFDLSKIILNN